MNVIKMGYPNKCACPEGTSMTTPPFKILADDNIPLWGNIRRKAEGEEGPEWVVRSKFEDKISGFMLEKNLHAKRLGEMLNQHRNRMPEQFSQILATIGKSQTPTPKPDAPNFSITARSGTTTHDPPYPTSPSLTTVDNTKRTIEEERAEGEEKTTIQGKETPYRLPYSYQPTILEGHDSYDKGSQEELVPKGGRHRLFQTTMSYRTFGSNKCFGRLRVLEMDEDELVLIILGRPFLITACAVIDVHKGKLSLRVRNETVTFNIGKYMRSKYSRDDYLYCADHTTKLIHEQWVDTVNYDGKWIEMEEDNPEEIRAVSFYPR
ncbi:hypothetical protein Tco_1536457 [Tanacetum coccineum]